MFDQIIKEQFFSGFHRTPPDLGRLYYTTGYDIAGIDLEGKTVLDLCAGSGLFSLYFALKCGAKKVIALDNYEGEGSPIENKVFIENMIKQYDLGDKITSVTADACGESIPVDDESIDMVFLSSAIHHIYITEDDIRDHPSRPDHVVRFMRNVQRAVKSGGLVVVQEVLRHNITEILPRSWHNVDMNWKTKQDPEAWAQLFEEFDFKLDNILYYVPYKLRSFKPLLARRLFSYFLRSRYRLVLKK